MGGKQSKSARAEAAYNSLGPNLVATLFSVCGVNEKEQGSQTALFQNMLTTIPDYKGGFSEKIVSLIATYHKDQHDSPVDSLVVFVHCLYKGAPADRREIYQMLAASSGTMTRPELREFLDTVGRVALQMDSKLGGSLGCPPADTPLDPPFLDALERRIFGDLPPAFASEATSPPKETITGVEFSAALSKYPEAAILLDLGISAYLTNQWLFINSEGGKIPSSEMQSVMPVAPTPRVWVGPGSDPTHRPRLLTRETVWLLCAHLPGDCAREWRFLYDSKTQGMAFNRLVTHSSKHGSTLVVLRDTDGYVFGGFAAADWDKNSGFYGTNQGFVFSVCPVMEVYEATGYNTNFQYLNFGNKTLPNGLGFGGQIENYFGLFLDSLLEKGHSKAHPRCSTYGSPRLSKEEEFRIESVEVWAVGPEPEVEETRQKSALDDYETKAIMEMQGKKMWSAGLREPHPEDDETPEKK